MPSNNAVILRQYQPHGALKKGDTLAFEERPFELPELQDGDIVVQTMYLSPDPYMVSPRNSSAS